MDPLENPYSPGAGSPAPHLVGREPILEQSKILLGRAPSFHWSDQSVRG